MVTIRCHHHCEVSAPLLVLGQCRETVAPALAHSLGSQSVVSERSPTPSDSELAPHLETAFSTCSSIGGLGYGGGARPSPGNRGGQFLSPRGFWAMVAPCSSQVQSRGQGEVSGRMQWARASFWAPGGPAQFLASQKSPGQEENLSGELTVPEGGRKPTEWGSH